HGPSPASAQRRRSPHRRRRRRQIDHARRRLRGAEAAGSGRGRRWIPAPGGPGSARGRAAPAGGRAGSPGTRTVRPAGPGDDRSAPARHDGIPAAGRPRAALGVRGARGQRRDRRLPGRARQPPRDPPRGRDRLAGGRGSGVARGRAGLRAAFAAIDGTGEATSLTPLLAGPDPERTIRALYASEEQTREVAALAPRVLRAAADGDRTALAAVEG